MNSHFACLVFEPTIETGAPLDFDDGGAFTRDCGHFTANFSSRASLDENRYRRRPLVRLADCTTLIPITMAAMR